MYYFLSFVFFITMSYLLVRHLGVRHPDGMAPVTALVQKGVMDPLQALGDMVLPVQESRLSDWIPQMLGLSPRRYVPNPYGYGGLDPAGGERKGGNGLGIPDQVPVGWWTGEEVTYPARRLSPVQDEEQTPPEAKVAEVGWWGDDWMV